MALVPGEADRELLLCVGVASLDHTATIRTVQHCILVLTTNAVSLNIYYFLILGTVS